MLTCVLVPRKAPNAALAVPPAPNIATRPPKYGCNKFLNAKRSVETPMLPVDSKIIVLIDAICLANGSTRSTKPIDISLSGMVKANPRKPESLCE